MFAVFSSGGLTPVAVALSQFPELVIMSDGGVFQPGAQIAVFPPPLVPALERLQLDADGLARIEMLVAQSAVIAPDVEFGSPNVTDLPTTEVSSFFGEEELTVAVYALGSDDGLDDAATANRAELRSLLSAVRGIVSEFIATSELVEPLAAAVFTSPGLTVDPDAAPREWPIASTPLARDSGAACVVVAGDELSMLWAAAADANTHTPWDIDGTIAAVALRPVFPHEDIC